MLLVWCALRYFVSTHRAFHHYELTERFILRQHGWKSITRAKLICHWCHTQVTLENLHNGIHDIDVTCIHTDIVSVGRYLLYDQGATWITNCVTQSIECVVLHKDNERHWLGRTTTMVWIVGSLYEWHSIPYWCDIDVPRHQSMAVSGWLWYVRRRKVYGLRCVTWHWNI